MQKIIFLFSILAAAFLVVSCTPGNSPYISSQVATPVVTSKPTATPSAMACQVLHVPATPAALGAAFGERGHVTGLANAPVTIVVFSDYQCPACAFLAGSLKQIREAHPQDVRFVFVNTPLANRDKDALATQAVEAADLQGKFWEMHDLLYEKQAEWSSLAPAAFEPWAVQQAASLGLDPTQFQADFQGQTVAQRLQQITQSAPAQAIVPPILFVNGTSAYAGLADFASLDTVVRLDALAARQFSRCPA